MPSPAGRGGSSSTTRSLARVPDEASLQERAVQMRMQHQLSNDPQLQAPTFRLNTQKKYVLSRDELKIYEQIKRLSLTYRGLAKKEDNIRQKIDQLVSSITSCSYSGPEMLSVFLLYGSLGRGISDTPADIRKDKLRLKDVSKIRTCITSMQELADAYVQAAAINQQGNDIMNQITALAKAAPRVVLKA